MANIFQTIGSKLKAAVLKLGAWFTPERQKRALDVAEFVSEAIEYATPAAKLVASLTPDPVDDLVVAALERMNTTANAILTLEDERLRRDALLTLSAEVTRGVIAKRLAAGPITIGSFRITSADLLTLDALRAAAQAAYSMFFKQQVLVESAQ